MTTDEMQRFFDVEAEQGTSELEAYRKLMRILGIEFPSKEQCSICFKAPKPGEKSRPRALFVYCQRSILHELCSCNCRTTEPERSLAFSSSTRLHAPTAIARRLSYLLLDPPAVLLYELVALNALIRLFSKAFICCGEQGAIFTKTGFPLRTSA